MKSKTWIIFFVIIFCFVILAVSLSAFVYYFPQKHRDLIKLYSTQNNLNPSLVASIINAESRYNSNAKSSAGALGLMQIMPETAFWVAENNNILLNNEEELFEPQKNIEIGCCYLKILLTEFSNIKTVLCAYNAGPSYARLWLKNTQYCSDGKEINNPPFTETSNYVDKVLFYQKFYSFVW